MQDSWIVTKISYTGYEYYKDKWIDGERRYSIDNTYPANLIFPSDTARAAVEKVCGVFGLPFYESKIENVYPYFSGQVRVEYKTFTSYPLGREATKQELADWEAGKIPLCAFTICIHLMIGHLRKPNLDEVQLSLPNVKINHNIP